jgi:hypothetical protein
MCTNSTLNGKYGFYRTGTAMPGPSHLAAAGFMVFDGLGGFTAYQNASNDGVYVPNSESAGFYHVYHNCRFILSMHPYSDDPIDLTQIKTVGVIVDGGKELFALATDPHRTALFIAKKM